MRCIENSGVLRERIIVCKSWSMRKLDRARFLLMFFMVIAHHLIVSLMPIFFSMLSMACSLPLASIFRQTIPSSL